MFKKRMWFVLKNILFFTSVLITFALIVSVFSWILIRFPQQATTIVNTFMYLLIGIVGLGAILVVSMKLYEGIHWLFIEPYREHKRKKVEIE